MKKNPITHISSQVDKAQNALDAVDLRHLRHEPKTRQAIHEARSALAAAREELDARNSRLEVIRTA